MQFNLLIDPKNLFVKIKKNKKVIVDQKVFAG